MKEELQGKLVEILTSIQTAAGKASDFALEQLPDIAQSYVAFGRAAHTLGAIVGIALMVGALWGFWKASQESTSYRMEPPLVIGSMVGGFVGLMMAGFNVMPALLVWFAPKVWLLKELATLIK